MTKTDDDATGKADAAAIELWPIDRVRPYVRNARYHPPGQVADLAELMQSNGWTTPLVCADDGDLLLGHGRLAAAQLLDMDTVPVIVVTDLTDDERKAFRIADNRTPELGRWDPDQLARTVGDLLKREYDVGRLMFTDRQLAKMLADQQGDPEDDALPPMEDTAVSATGDVWVMGEHRLVCGDATDPAVMKAALGPHDPDLMVTDPPYGVDYTPTWRHDAGIIKSARRGAVKNDNRADWADVFTQFQGSAAYVWHAAQYAHVVRGGLEAAKLKVEAQIVWAKDNSTFGRGHYHQQQENCAYARRPRRADRWNAVGSQGTVWRISRQGQDAETTHGTQKPVECMRRPIRHSSRPGDAVLDPFMGSGTTLIAAQVTERIACGIELNPLYVDMAVRRWQAKTGQVAVLDGGKVTFTEREQGGKPTTAKRKRK